MEINRAELESLKLLVEALPGPTPMQAAALHDVVVQAYLASDQYEIAQPTDVNPVIPGFMGLRWSQISAYDVGTAVPVEERIPGFPGFQMLREGDMIIGIYFDPNAPLDQLPNQRTISYRMISESISGRGGGLKQVVLEVLRQGQHIQVPVRLAPRPAALMSEDPNATTTFLAARISRAEQYWHNEFLPLVQKRAT